MTEGRHPVAPSAMRAAIGRRMVHSKLTAPHFYVAAELELDALLAVADRLNEDRSKDDRLTVTAFLVKGVALTLAEHPAFNAVWQDESLELVDAINVGVAIALEDGLIAPAVLGCQDLDLEATAGALRDLVARTRAGKLRAQELTDATFTLSNLGMFDVSAFTAIITPPQVAILATAKTEPRAVVRDGQIAVRQIMTATLSADHRAVDGAGAARFLGSLRNRLLEPESLLAHGTRAPAPVR
jgi:pyruvate dehydrogenase E2 component (dihydrolipoyllysine-residue acetyltransferase)